MSGVDLPAVPTPAGDDRTVLGMLRRRHDELEGRLNTEVEGMKALKAEHDKRVMAIRAELADVKQALDKLEAA